MAERLDLGLDTISFVRNSSISVYRLMFSLNNFIECKAMCIHITSIEDLLKLFRDKYEITVFCRQFE